jgi:putative ABC transport system permease protein
MSTPMRILRRLSTLLRGRRAAEEFDKEVRFHLDHLEQRHRAAGLDADVAAAKARQEFGDPIAFREQAQDIWFGRWMVDLLQDLQYAVRMLTRQPAFASIAIATLAIGIAANTALFSVVQAVMLQPLAYRDPSRLVVIWDRDARQKGAGKLFAQYRDLEHWRAHSRTLEQVAGATWAIASPILTGHGPARSVLAVASTVELFPLLGVAPHAGRTFERDDLTRGCSLVLAYRFWHDVLAAPADLAGLHLALDNRACSIVGVMPREFVFFPEPTEVWVLITPTDPLVRGGDAASGVAVFGRLTPDVTAAAVQSELQALSRQIDNGVRYGAQMEPVVFPLQEEFTFLAGANLRLSLLVLLGAVIALLLIACVNVANLLMGQSLGRQRELAIRAAIGSGRGRLLRQLLTESLLLATLATTLGVLLASVAVREFRYLDPIQLPAGSKVEMNLPVLGFAITLAVLTTVLFGLWPAWKMSRPGAQDGLVAGTRGGSARQNHVVIKSLVVGEIALSFALLVSGALLTESVLRFSSAPLGFNPDGLVFETIRLPAGSYAAAPQRGAFFDRAVSALSADPDVERVAFSTALPLRGAQGSAALVVEGRPIPSAGSAVPDVGGQLVTSDYFRILDIALERGRGFSPLDRESGAPVAIINNAAARRYFPNEDPLGRRIRFFGDAGPNNPWLTIVGIVESEKRHRPDQEMAWGDAPILYRAFDRTPPRVANALIRLRGGDRRLESAVQRELSAIDPGVVVGDAETARHFVNRYFAYPQFRAALLGAFAVVALLLALVGLYGVLSQLVAQRVREIGIRMALGATRAKVLTLIVTEGMSVTMLGLAGGVLIALWASTSLASLLFGVRPHDPLTLGGVAVTLCVTSLVAVLAPAVRAANTDPVVAIRQE